MGTTIHIINKKRNINAFLISFFFFAFYFFYSSPSHSFTLPFQQTTQKEEKTHLPLPRFVSLKSNRVNLRKGPGLHYPVNWLYIKGGLPVEIIQEYDHWRRIRDMYGVEGWINRSLLSGKRTGIVAPWKKDEKIPLPLMQKPHEKAKIIAFLEPCIIGKIKSCNGKWCNMVFGNYRGWITQSLIWGVYPDEKIN